MNANKQITLDMFLTDAELEQCGKLYDTLGTTGKFAKTVCAEVITPKIERINAALGQENDPMFLAYAVEYVLMQLKKKGAR